MVRQQSPKLCRKAIGVRVAAPLPNQISQVVIPLMKKVYQPCRIAMYDNGAQVRMRARTTGH